MEAGRSPTMERSTVQVSIRALLSESGLQRLERARLAMKNFAKLHTFLDIHSVTVPKETVEPYIKEMKKYIRKRHGKLGSEVFMCFHETLNDIIEEVGLESVMAELRSYFRDCPVSWFFYSLYLEPDKRMMFKPLLDWAIEALSPSLGIWDRAVVKRLMEIRAND